MSTLAALQYGYPEALRAAVALYLRWRGADAYRARSYCYAVAIAFGGVALFAGNALLLGMALGSG